MVKWGCEYGCFQLLFYGTGNPQADKKVPFFEVGSCSWGTYWQFNLGYNRLLIMRKINKFSVYSQL